MYPLKDKINTFFDEYADRFNKSLEDGHVDVEKTAQCFTELFLEASPLGVNCGKNNEQFKQEIPKGYEFYKSIGIKSMNILSKEITILDTYHVMVAVKWQSTFQRKDDTKGSVDFNVFYLLQIQQEVPKIFAYITGDEQEVLKQEGLI